jgi:hypothetical protein
MLFVLIVIYAPGKNPKTLQGISNPDVQAQPQECKGVCVVNGKGLVEVPADTRDSAVSGRRNGFEENGS